MRKIEFIISIRAKIEDDNIKKQEIDEIGRFLAEDIENSMQNGEDFLETEYIGVFY